MSDARITIRLPEEDSTWIKAQSEALGLDNAAAVVRMLIRQARLGDVSLSVILKAPRVKEPSLPFPMPTNPYVHAYHSPEPGVGDAYADDAQPVPEGVAEDILASRLQELAATAPTIATVDGFPVAASTPAISLRPAPARQGRDYR